MKKRIIGAAAGAALLAGALVAPASAATGDWHSGEGVSSLGLGLELSWKDTRRGVSVEGIWIHPAGAASATYTIKGYSSTGALLYETQVVGAAGDDCIGTPYEEIPNPNVYGSIASNGSVLVEVSYFGYHPQYGYVSDSVALTAVRG